MPESYTVDIDWESGKAVSVTVAADSAYGKEKVPEGLSGIASSRVLKLEINKEVKEYTVKEGEQVHITL